MLWFTSDLHFGHKNVIEYTGRPFSTKEEMHGVLITNWNKKVQPQDTIVIAGDLALCTFKEFEPIATQLNGKKILVQGNHDHYSKGQYEKLGFDVYQELVMNLCGHRVRISHFPYAPTAEQRLTCFPSELRFLERRPPRVEGEFLIHGHTHMKIREEDNRIHVGVDAWNYSPVSLREIESILSKKVKNGS